MRTLVVELRKAILNRWFVVALLVGCALALSSAYGSIQIYMATYTETLQDSAMQAKYDLALSASSLFRFTMISDYIQPTTDLFYALLPFLAALPYGWSLVQERRRGYTKCMYVQAGRGRYLAAKATAAFVSGVLAVGIPIAVNVVVSACFIPGYFTDIETAPYSGVYETVLWSDVYYNNPLQFCLMFLVFDVVFAGLWAACVCMFGLFVSNAARLIAGFSVVPYLIGAFERQVACVLVGTGTDYLEFAPTYLLRAVKLGGCGSTFAVVLWVVTLAVFCAALIKLAQRRDVL